MKRLRKELLEAIIDPTTELVLLRDAFKALDKKPRARKTKFLSAKDALKYCGNMSMENLLKWEAQGLKRYTPKWCYYSTQELDKFLQLEDVGVC